MREDQVRALEGFARRELRVWGPYGYSHVRRVLRLCLLIGGEEGADLDVLRAAALLHDVAKPREGEHGALGAEVASRVLGEMGLGGEFIDRVGHAIRAHTRRVEPETLEARVLRDADTIDKWGAVGVARFFFKALRLDMGVEEALEVFRGEPRAPFYVSRGAGFRTYTETGRRIVEERRGFTLRFFEQLGRELV